MFKTLIIALLMSTAANATDFVKQPLRNNATVSSVIFDFDTSQTSGWTLNSTNAGIYQGSSSVAAAPKFNGTKYFSVLGGGQATFVSPIKLQTFGFDWGSIDSYNTINFFSGNSLVSSFTGTQVLHPLGADGNQNANGTNQRVTFNFYDEGVNKVQFLSSRNSFEFDNISALAVPEPQTWAMLVLGFGIVGITARRKNNVVYS
jgi:PEP-CTERM motif